ncbi:MAG TPA: sigma-54 dependent transcriptional regulator [Rhodocyclaceae bacterium]|nr:sigma-54 dependent transcriptional regulator [Rhodocyclaceae bacterium]HNH35273.1 sigma-54 dependent transcriptional regulator [Rhodocyclaceae bacterium]
MNKGKVLIVDDEEVALRNLQHVMAKEGHEVTATRSGLKALGLLRDQRFDVVLTDLRMEKVDGLEILRHARAADPAVEVVLITGHASAASAVEAMKQGAFYYLAKPYRLDEVRKVVAEAVEKVMLKRENIALREQLDGAGGGVRFITQDKVMTRLLETARQVAPTGCTIIVTGESGTGKELLARFVHHCSDRRQGPYVAVNCAAFTETLLDNELFGHEKGAFTGAAGAKRGLVEASSGGTLFLDEITGTSGTMQVKLLRVLQEREVLRVGATRPVKCDIRVIAATNEDIAEAVRRGAFRQDLYYRLNVVNLHLPPLRERTGDIPLLATHFLERFAARMRRDVRGFSPEALALLTAHGFPGNVRELENIVERGTAMAVGPAIEARDLPDELKGIGVITVRRRDGRLPTLEEQEREYIGRVLAETGGNQTAAAQILGINRASLWRKLKARGESG